MTAAAFSVNYDRAVQRGKSDLSTAVHLEQIPNSPFHGLSQ